MLREYLNVNYPSEISPGTLIDRRYEVVKTLGQGGFGRTYLAKDERRFKKCCVLKEFVPQVTGDYAISKSRELFEREAKVLNQLEHRQIPKFFGWFKENERLFLVQQFVDGKTYADILAERQQQNQVFSEAEVIQLLKNILPILSYIHDNNIIHRDISPDNIMQCQQLKKPILIDFGVVNQTTATQVASGGMIPGTTVGKQSYAPVEQIARGVCYPNSDLYALAVTALNLLTGKPPRELIDSDDGSWQWRKHVHVSDSLGQIIDKMLSPIPRDRYQSAQEVLQALDPVVKPTEIIPDHSEHPDHKYSPKSNLGLPLMLAGIATIGIIGGLFFWQTPNIKGLCETLNNCSIEIELEAQYQQIADQAKPVIAIAANDHNLQTYDWQQLEELKNKLDKIVVDLETTPTTDKTAPEIEQTLGDVQTQIQRIETAMSPDLPDNMFENPQVNQ